MSDQAFLERLSQNTKTLLTEGLFKVERVLNTPQQMSVGQVGVDPAINLCANNYLGLANHPDIVAAAHAVLDDRGYGMASVRFICGTQDTHTTLEARLSQFLSTDATILYGSCFDANTGLFETILGTEDAIISDALNHASIIDGVRLCKAERFRYANNDMADLERQLQLAAGARTRLIATDGVFSMDGVIANLPAICDLADEYGALVMVDDSHAVGVLGPSGAGTPDHWNVQDRIDIVTGTLGKALGGASGGYTSGRAEIVNWLRQRSRPYLFSNSLAPMIAGTSIRALDLVQNSPDLRQQLSDNARYFRLAMTENGFTLAGADHPIVPVMIGDAALAGSMAADLLEEGVFVVGFSFPVVPLGQARIRTQMSAAHTQEQLDHAVQAFKTVGQRLGIVR